ncbi:MAG TPA: hypothetical protein DCM05_06355 [Elusimicrobia bacterium]|nr:hypothetical protein [Elusimicrobiota bacterium]
MKTLFRALAGLAAAVCPAAAQTLVLPAPRLALPVAPIARPLAQALLREFFARLDEKLKAG